MKKFFRGYTTLPLEKSFPAVTEKAVAVTIAGGVTTARDRVEWLPKSQLIIGEPNEAGNAEILIPYWLVKSKTNFDPTDLFRRMREIGKYNGENEIVER